MEFVAWPGSPAKRRPPLRVPPRPPVTRIGGAEVGENPTDPRPMVGITGTRLGDSRRHIEVHQGKMMGVHSSVVPDDHRSSRPVVRLSPAGVGFPTPRQALTIAVTGIAVTWFAGFMIAIGWRGYGPSVWAFWLSAPIGLSFTAAGLTAWWRWPANHTGPLMVLGGACWYLSTLQQFHHQVLYAFGYWLAYLDLGIFLQVTLAYPEGRLTRRADRRLVFSTYLLYLVLQGIRYLLEADRGPVGLHPAPSTALGDLISIVAVTVSVIACGLLLRRWSAASPPARRIHGPVWLGTVLSAVIMLLAAIGSVLRLPQTLQLVLLVGYGACLLALPFAFLSGLVRMRLARSRVADVLVELERTDEPARLRDLLAWALGDPSLVLGFWSADAGRYLDAQGGPVFSDALVERSVTVVERGEQRLAVENARLQAVLRASGRRAAQAALEERHRIERNLHDGIQQRLLRLTWLAKRARSIATEGSASGMVGVLDELAEEAHDTFVELREVAHGIHPSLVTERGLAVAVEEYALQAPVVVTVDLPPGRWPTPVEITAFFVVSEAVVNAVKHAGIDRVAVSGRERPGWLTVEVCDEGRGRAARCPGAGPWAGR